jgi:hypothetical protein
VIEQQRDTTSFFSAVFMISAVNDKCRLISSESKYLRAYKAPLQLSRILYRSALFMQNKPNFLDAKMNVTSIQITSYLLPFTNYQYAKQSQSNPIRSELVEPIHGEPVESTCSELARPEQGRRDRIQKTGACPFRQSLP